MAICSQSMQRTWWPVVSATIVTASYCLQTVIAWNFLLWFNNFLAYHPRWMITLVCLSRHMGNFPAETHSLHHHHCHHGQPAPPPHYYYLILYSFILALHGYQGEKLFCAWHTHIWHNSTGLGPEYLVLVLVVLEYLISVLVLVLRPLGT